MRGAARRSAPGACARIGAALAALLLGAAPLTGQVNVESFARVGFNFSPPGARSAALGGAFIPLADDATAAETNPAGLTILLRPQLSAEFKGIDYVRHVPREAGGGPDGADFADFVFVPSFASAVLPLLGGRLTLAAFRHELVNYRSTTAGRGFDTGGGGYLLPLTSELGMRVENYGAAAGLRLGRTISVGVAGGVSLLNLDVNLSRYLLELEQPGFLWNRFTVSGDDGRARGMFVNAGLLVRPTPAFSFGAVAKLRPTFTALHYDWVDTWGQPFAGDHTFRIKVPDAFGAGIALRPHDLVTLSVAGVYNLYSQIPAEQSIAVAPDTDRPEHYVADDGFDLHAGLEMIAFVARTPIALRAGAAYLAPSNTYYTGPGLGSRLLFGEAADDAVPQLSGGLGTVLFRVVQLDVAASLSRQRSEAMASVVFLF